MVGQWQQARMSRSFQVSTINCGTVQRAANRPCMGPDTSRNNHSGYGALELTSYYDEELKQRASSNIACGKVRAAGRQDHR